MKFSNPVLAACNIGISSDIKLPANLKLSCFATLNDRWDVLGDARWTQWSTIQTMRFVRDSGTTPHRTPENFKDTWKVALGAHDRYNGAWTLRGGFAFDQSPVLSAGRTPRSVVNGRLAAPDLERRFAACRLVLVLVLSARAPRGWPAKR